MALTPTPALWPPGALATVLALAASLAVTVSGLMAWNTVTWAGSTIIFPWIRAILIPAVGLMLLAILLAPIASPDRVERVARVTVPLVLCLAFIVAGRWNRVSVDALLRRIETDPMIPKGAMPMAARDWHRIERSNTEAFTSMLASIAIVAVASYSAGLAVVVSLTAIAQSILALMATRRSSADWRTWARVSVVVAPLCTILGAVVALRP